MDSFLEMYRSIRQDKKASVILNHNKNVHKNLQVLLFIFLAGDKIRPSDSIAITNQTFFYNTNWTIWSLNMPQRAELQEQPI